ncbi:helix-turn-helix transcriptional regulator [Ferrovum myxofaciens]|uniref:helix-turn-helix transcriptional regulator n=1 Tax=Ferrovum myxofaciens TaxID=416213 RepID=UPI0023557BFD|nr:AlpA family phage regulatory protein [Ferrovum myxofaciens]MBU6994779.1 AlpA family phage regulatory protein [Ferrovum myxofaciens]
MEKILIGQKEVQKLLGMGQTTFYRFLRKYPNFPKGVPTPSHKKWRSSEVREWIAAR